MFRRENNRNQQIGAFIKDEHENKACRNYLISLNILAFIEMVNLETRVFLYNFLILAKKITVIVS